jgi:predicted Fe-Mo cluster-binding NifX family protein
MKIAIPIWHGRISPVMDTARQLMIADTGEKAETSRRILDIPALHIFQLAHFISDLGVEVLICGAISRQLELALEQCGLRIRPWVRGEVDDIVAAFNNGNLQDEYFFLPGIGRRRHRRKECRHGHPGGRRRGSS